MLPFAVPVCGAAGGVHAPCGGVVVFVFPLPLVVVFVVDGFILFVIHVLNVGARERVPFAFFIFSRSSFDMMMLFHSSSFVRFVVVFPSFDFFENPSFVNVYVEPSASV